MNQEQIEQQERFQKIQELKTMLEMLGCTVDITDNNAIAAVNQDPLTGPETQTEIVDVSEIANDDRIDYIYPAVFGPDIFTAVCKPGYLFAHGNREKVGSKDEILGAIQTIETV